MESVQDEDPIGLKILSHTFLPSNATRNSIKTDRNHVRRPSWLISSTIVLKDLLFNYASIQTVTPILKEQNTLDALKGMAKVIYAQSGSVWRSGSMYFMIELISG